MTVEFSSAEENSGLPGVVDISPEEFKGRIADVVLIDVRRHDEYVGELGHIPGARLITLDVLGDELGEFSKDTPMVFVCRSGGRSGRAASLAQAKGFKNVFNLKGGMMLWNELQYEVTTEEMD